MRSRIKTYRRRVKARKRRFWESQRFWVAVMWVAIALFARDAAGRGVPRDRLPAADRRRRPAPRGAQGRGDRREPRALVEALIEYLSEDLGCDHKVGICMCGTQGVVTELRLALKGEMTCPKCGGESFVWDQEAHDRELARMRAAYPAWAVDGEYGHVNCTACASSGVVSIKEEAK